MQIAKCTWMQTFMWHCGNGDWSMHCFLPVHVSVGYSCKYGADFITKSKQSPKQCLWNEILSQHRIRHYDRIEYIFRLQNRHHQLLFK